MSTENQVTVRATVNGERREYPAKATLLQVIEGLGLAPERVAIELDRAIVKREFWETTEVREGAEIEIVMFVGGG